MKHAIHLPALLASALIANAAPPPAAPVDASAVARSLRLPALFSDHAVFQRDLPVPVWGWADPGATVSVEFGAQRKTGAAGADGAWRVVLDPMPATDAGRPLVVRARRPGAQGAQRSAGDAACSVEVTDVLVGEVWLGSGQSNMAMTVDRARDVEAERAAARSPRIRMFTERSGAAPAPAAVGSGQWILCAPESVGAFSATLYFFGRDLHRELCVPMGLINSSVGGTPIESWIAADAQAGCTALKPRLEELRQEAAQFDPTRAKAAYDHALVRWQKHVAQARAEGKPAPEKPRDPIATRARKGGLGGLFNGKIAPLIPYAIRGALWYQGEANARLGRAQYYRHQLPLLVRDWRARWGRDFPFAWVQLPNFVSPGTDWPTVREAMLHALSVPDTGMAITIDIGDPKDIHPKNKQDVGKRLAAWALGTVYGHACATSGPLPAGHDIRGAEIILKFRHTDGGLVARGGELKGFTVAAADRIWHPAQARIAGGDTVVVSSPDGKTPVAARYAWENNPECSLYNAAGLPASPFRTDNFPPDPAPAAK